MPASAVFPVLRLRPFLELAPRLHNHVYCYRRENAWTVGLDTRQLSHLERCLALQFGRPREENS